MSIKFDAKNHVYTHNGQTLISTTQLLKKYGLSADYANIPKHVLEKAAKKGRAVHGALEKYIKGDTTVISLFDEVGQFDYYVKQRGLDITQMKSEHIVYDLNFGVAGTLDLSYDDNGPVIADFKTTSTLHLDAVSWQLSIYNYMVTKGNPIDYYFTNLKVYHFQNGKFYVKDIYTQEFDAVEALLECFKRGDATFNYVRPSQSVTPTQELYIKQLMHEIKVNKLNIEGLQLKLDAELRKVKDNFEKNKEHAYVRGDLSLKYQEPSTRVSLNQTKAKEFIITHGGNIDDFMNVSTTGAKVSARIVKPKDDKKNP